MLAFGAQQARADAFFDLEGPSHLLVSAELSGATDDNFQGSSPEGTEVTSRKQTFAARLKKPLNLDQDPVVLETTAYGDNLTSNGSRSNGYEGQCTSSGIGAAEPGGAGVTANVTATGFSVRERAAKPNMSLGPVVFGSPFVTRYETTCRNAGQTQTTNFTDTGQSAISGEGVDSKASITPLGCGKATVCDYRVTGQRSFKYDGPAPRGGTNEETKRTASVDLKWNFVIRVVCPLDYGLPSKPVTNPGGRVQPVKACPNSASGPIRTPRTATAYNMGIVCGVARFAFYTVAGQRESIRRGEKACSIAVSNRATRELINQSGNLSSAIVRRFGTDIAKQLGDDAAREAAEFELKRRGKKLAAALLGDVGKTLLKVDLRFTIGKAVGLLAVPFAAGVHLKHVKKYKGCTRLLLDVDGKRLKVSGGLLYSPTGLHKPRRDRALTVAGTYQRKSRRLRGDDFVKRSAGLRCTKKGFIARDGGSRMFSSPVRKLVTGKR